MSQTSSKNRKNQPEKKKVSRKTVIAIGIVLVICIIAAACVFLLRLGPLSPGTSGNATTPFSTAGAYYCMSVDLANARNYQSALEDADEALKQNVSSLTPLIQANRAGILVELGRNDEAIAAADV